MYAANVPDVSFLDVVEFDLGTVRECASFECRVESSSDLHFQVDPSGNNQGNGYTFTGWGSGCEETLSNCFSSLLKPTLLLKEMLLAPFIYDKNIIRRVSISYSKPSDNRSVKLANYNSPHKPS